MGAAAGPGGLLLSLVLLVGPGGPVDVGGPARSVAAPDELAAPGEGLGESSRYRSPRVTSSDSVSLSRKSIMFRVDAAGGGKVKASCPSMSMSESSSRSAAEAAKSSSVLPGRVVLACAACNP